MKKKLKQHLIRHIDRIKKWKRLMTYLHLFLFLALSGGVFMISHSNFVNAWTDFVFDDLELYFIKSDGTVGHYTIIDRNLWATEPYNQDWSNQNTGSYGYYYKWWNNTWYIANDPGIVDEQPWTWIEREQWPCPTWYYIPNDTDFQDIYEDWIDSTATGNWKQFASDLLLPPAGYIQPTSSTLSMIGIWNYWSSVYSGGDFSKNLRFSQSQIYPQKSSTRPCGNTIRCFKTSPNNILIINSGGWTGAVIAFTGTIENGRFTVLDNPTRWEDEFLWWYDENGNKLGVWSWVVAHLYTKFHCQDGYIENAQWLACVESFTIILNPNWWSVETWMVAIWSGDTFDLSWYISTRPWFLFLGWWNNSGDTEILTTNPIITWDTTLYAVYDVDSNNNWIADENEKYTITFDSQWWDIVLSQENIPLYATWTKPSDPSRLNSVFLWWYLSWSETEFDFVNTEITWDIVLYAHWNCNNGYIISSDGQNCERVVWWWGWWRIGWSKKDNCPNWDNSPSFYDWKCGDTQSWNTITEQENTHGSAENKCSIEWSKYTEELNWAYQYACDKWITTMENIQKADLVWPLLRKHLAKMISEFAMQELWMQPDKDKLCKFNDMNKESDEMQEYAQIACQLWFMWLYSDGVQVKDNFAPNDQVTRAEFWTVLSRLLRWTKYATDDGNLFYKYHLEALKEKWIMTKIYGDWPNSIELRWYVMIMLKRISWLEDR